jgi:hypothetical protein
MVRNIGKDKQMERQPVTSSNLRSVGYDPDSRTLEIEFQTGRVWRYAGVPPSVYSTLMAADSKGSYFNSLIRDVYPDIRVS